MKEHKFAIDDRVVTMLDEEGDLSSELMYDEYNELFAGKIVALPTPGKALVQWDDKNYGLHPEVDLDQILPEAVAQKKYARLEEEFHELEQQISDKMKEAAKLLREANKLAKKSGRNLHDMWEATSPLLNAMDASGWHSSSFDC